MADGFWIGVIEVVGKRAEKVSSGNQGALFVQFGQAGGPPIHESDDELQVFKADADRMKNKKNSGP